MIGHAHEQQEAGAEERNELPPMRKKAEKDGKGEKKVDYRRTNCEGKSQLSG